MLLLPILLPVLGGAIAFASRKERIRHIASLLSLFAAAVTVAVLCVTGAQRLVLLRLAGGLTLALSFDGVSRFFALLFSVVWTVVAPFAVPYIRHEGHGARFFGFYTMTLGVLMGLACADNLITLYLFYEMMTLITVPLVLHTGTQEAHHAAVKYLGYSVAGAALALLGAFIIASGGGMESFASGGNLTDHRDIYLTAWLLMVIGFGCKAGMLPMQAWLTTAHPVAPAPASAVMSGIITKAGVLGILRTTYFIFGADMLRGSAEQKILLTMALVTVFTGSMLAYKEKLMKKRLAYSTVSQVSYALLGLLLLTPDGVVGALAQVLFHACAKNTLFLTAGAMIYRTGRLRCAEYAGIGLAMPGTLWCFTLAALSLIGIPPFGGFYAKWYLAAGALKVNFTFGCIAAAVLLVSALLTALYLLPTVTKGFFPGPEATKPETCEVGALMLAPMALFALATLLLGLFSLPLQRTLSALGGMLLP